MYYFYYRTIISKFLMLIRFNLSNTTCFYHNFKDFLKVILKINICTGINPIARANTYKESVLR